MYGFIRGDIHLSGLFDSVIVYGADNRDFFDWQVQANGILTPNTLDAIFNDALLSIEYPVLTFGLESSSQRAYEDSRMVRATDQMPKAIME